MAAIEEHRSDEEDPKEEQSRHHAEASKPEGPAEPKVLKATDLMGSPFMPSYVTKCGEWFWEGVEDSLIAEESAGCGGGCLSNR